MLKKAKKVNSKTLEKINNWFKNNLLELNMKKFKFMYFEIYKISLIYSTYINDILLKLYLVYSGKIYYYYNLLWYYYFGKCI